MREPDRIVRLKTVLARTGLSRSTIYHKIAEGTFPTQIKISTNGTGWHESDINRWIADPVSCVRNTSSIKSDEAGSGMSFSREPISLHQAAKRGSSSAFSEATPEAVVRNRAKAAFRESRSRA